MSRRQLHATLSEVGRTAAEARVGALLLTHVMPELEEEREAAEQLIRRHHEGPVRWTEDQHTVRPGL